MANITEETPEDLEHIAKSLRAFAQSLDAFAEQMRDRQLKTMPVKGMTTLRGATLKRLHGTLKSISDALFDVPTQPSTAEKQAAKANRKAAARRQQDET